MKRIMLLLVLISIMGCDAPTETTTRKVSLPSPPPTPTPMPTSTRWTIDSTVDVEVEFSILGEWDSVRWSPDGNRLLLMGNPTDSAHGCGARRCLLIVAKTGDIVLNLPDVQSALWHSSSNHLLITDAPDARTYQSVNIATDERFQLPEVNGRIVSATDEYLYIPNEDGLHRRKAEVSPDGEVRLSDVERLLSFREEEPYLRDISVLEGSSWLMQWDRQRRVDTWKLTNVQTGTEYIFTDEHYSIGTCCAWSAAVRTFAYLKANETDASIQFVDMATGRAEKVLAFDDIDEVGTVRSMTFSPAGDYLLLAWLSDVNEYGWSATELLIANAAHEQILPLALSPRPYHWPTWSPVDDRIAFYTDDEAIVLRLRLP